MLYALSKIVWLFAEPSRILLLAALAGFFAGRRLLWAALGAIALLTVAPLGGLALWRLEATFPPLSDPGRLDGIVVIGGALSSSAFDALPASGFGPAFGRLYEAARLAKAHPEARLLDVGGPTPPAPGRAEADQAADVLVSLGIARERIEIERRIAQYLRERRGCDGPRPSAAGAEMGASDLGVSYAARGRLLPRGRVRGDRRSRRLPLDPPPVIGFDVTGGLADFDLATHEYVGLASYRWLGRTNAIWPGP